MEYSWNKRGAKPRIAHGRIAAEKRPRIARSPCVKTRLVESEPLHGKSARTGADTDRTVSIARGDAKKRRLQATVAGIGSGSGSKPSAGQTRVDPFRGSPASNGVLKRLLRPGDSRRGERRQQLAPVQAGGGGTIPTTLVRHRSPFPDDHWQHRREAQSEGVLTPARGLHPANHDLATPSLTQGDFTRRAGRRSPRNLTCNTFRRRARNRVQATVRQPRRCAQGRSADSKNHRLCRGSVGGFSGQLGTRTPLRAAHATFWEWLKQQHFFQHCAADRQPQARC